MSRRRRTGIVAVASGAVLAATLAYGVTAWADRDVTRAVDSAAPAAAPGRWAGGDRIVFRSTAPGAGYGHVASVPLSHPSGRRTESSEVCDRLDATATLLSCLRIVRAVVPTYSATITRADGSIVGAWPLPGIPSRTRISPSGGLLTTTSFVTGHSYATVGFSTETVIARPDGTSLGSLEEWTLRREGEVFAAEDRNFWGVTFADDDTFYASVGLSSSGRTWLVRGDVPTRTMVTLAENVECPSLSPDRSRIAFKRVTGAAPGGSHWTPAVYDIGTGEIRELPEPRSIDDQIEWLDDDTLLYGMPRPDAPGSSDVWRLSAEGTDEPAILIEQAWSPSVVRDGNVG